MKSRSGEYIYNALMAIAKEQKPMAKESIQELTDEVQRRRYLNKTEKFFYRIIRREVPIDEKDKDGNTLLINAAASGNVELVKALLIKCGADASIPSNEGYSFRYCLSTAMLKFARNNQLKKLRDYMALDDMQEYLTPEIDPIKNILSRKIMNDARQNYFDPVLKKELPKSFLQSCIESSLVSLFDHEDYMAIKNLLSFPHDVAITDACWERLLISVIRFAAAGNLQRLRIIKESLPKSYFNAFVASMKSRLSGALRDAIDHDRHGLAQWFIKEYHVDPVLPDGTRCTYVEYVNYHFIELAKEKKHKRMAEVISKFPDVTLTYLNNKAENAEVLLFHDFCAAVKENDASVIENIKKISPGMKLFGDTLDHLEASLRFEQALVRDDKSQAKSLLSYDVLTSQLPETKMYPAELALSMDDTQFATYLIEHGGVCGRPLSGRSGIAATCAKFNSGLDEVLASLKTDIAKITFSEAMEMKQAEQLKISVVKNIIDNINSVLVDAPSLHPYEKLDLIFLIRSLLPVLRQNVTQYELEKKIKDILAQREEAVAGTIYDYCYMPSSVVNKLCIVLAKSILEDMSLNNRLFYQACHKDRASPWFDPAMGVDAVELPSDSSQFFRLPNHEIHLYEYVAESAIARLKQGVKLKEHIWFGTDPKHITPVPPLNEDALYVLKQRSPTLKKLVEFTESLDRVTKERMRTNIFEQLSVLRDGLYAGDYTKTKDHLNAGEAAYANIAMFADWWNQLKARQPEMCERIKNLGHNYYGTHETLGHAINVVLDYTNTEKGNTERADNAIYCVHLKANILDRILKEKTVENALKDMQSQPSSAEQKTLSQGFEQLDAWLADIKKELTISPKGIMTHHVGKFPPMGSWEEHLFLCKEPMANEKAEAFVKEIKHGLAKATQQMLFFCKAIEDVVVGADASKPDPKICGTIDARKSYKRW